MSRFAELEVQRLCYELMFEVLFPKKMPGKERLKQLRLNVERRLTSLGYLPRIGYKWVVRKDGNRKRLYVESERVTFEVNFCPIPPTSIYVVSIGITYNQMVGKELEAFQCDHEFPACEKTCSILPLLGAGECESVCPDKFGK